MTLRKKCQISKDIIWNKKGVGNLKGVGNYNGPNWLKKSQPKSRLSYYRCDGSRKLEKKPKPSN